MGLRSPQEMQLTKTAPEGSTRFQGAVAPKIGTEFFSVLSQRLSAQETARLKAEQDRIKYITTDSDNEVERLRIEAQNELSGLQGLEAVRKAPAIEQNFRKKVADSFGQYPSEYHPYLAQNADKVFNKYKSFDLPYVSGQVKTVYAKAQDTQIANRMNEAVERSGDEEFFSGEGLDNVIISLSNKANAKYGDPEIAKIAVNEGVSKTIKEAVIQQVKIGALGRAGQIAELHNDKLIPSDRNKVADALKEASSDLDTRNALNISTIAQDKFGSDLVKQEEYLRVIAPSYKVYTQAINMSKRNVAIAEDQKRRNTEALMEKLNNDARNGIPLTLEQINQLPSGEREKYLGNGSMTSVTNWETFNKVYDRLNGMSPDEAKNFKIGAYSNVIAPDQMKLLQSRRAELMQANQQDKNQAQKSTLKDANDIVNLIALENNVFPKSPEMGKLRELGMQEWDRLKGDKNITVKELRARIYSAYKQRYKVQTPTNKSFWQFWKSETETKVNDSLAPDMNSIHPTQREELRRQAMKAFGRPISLQEENQQLERLLNQGVDLTKPR